MATLEEFGPYLLLKKLGEDSLGESFRAGRLGGQGVEQVVLLRVFNGRNINGAHLWQRIRDREPVQEALKSPNIGDGVGLGEVRGIPYAAYDYISGKSLTQLLLQASNENQPIPADHALLIAERVALALATALETRVAGERLVHGFLVPHLVMISNEGESRVLGFEAAPGLVDLAGGGAFGGDITRYPAPEALAGGRAEKADDVYSLGVLLFELLTCQPLPKAGDGGYGPVLQAARVAADGSPLAPEVNELLSRSLAPRAQRLSDAGAWHKAVSKLVVEGGQGATTFNLAFFMHNLFRSEIEQESKEIEAEKTIEVPGQAIAAATAAAAAGAPPAKPPQPAAEVTGSAVATGDDDTASVRERYGIDGKTGGGKGLWIGIAAALLVAAMAAGWYFLLGPGAGGGQDRAAASEQTTSPPPPPLTEEVPAEELAPEPQGPTAEELQTQLAEMIDSRSEEMEAKLRQQYDERIKKLQDELAESQAAATAREEALARERQRQAEEEARAAEQAAAAEKEAAATAEPAETAEEQAAAGGGDNGQSGGAPAAGAQQPAAQAAGTGAPVPPKAAPEPAEPAVRLGDLVSFGPGVTPPDLIRMPEPRYPPMARKLGKEAIVELRLLVDETGEVMRSEVVGGKIGYGFDEAALDAVNRAKYRPATKDGVRVKMWTSVKLRFENPG